MSFPVCLVTGAATGIGAATALRFAQDGWAVAINNFDDSTRAAAEAVAAQCRDAGVQTLVVDADVGDDAACRRMADAVGEKWGRLDALVNSAGTTRVIPHGDLEAIDAVEFERIYRVNLIGMFQMTRAAAPLLRERPVSAASAVSAMAASVVNISSLASLNGTGSSIAYAASKGAVNALTLSLARNLAPHVRVNAIAPGMVDDGLLRRVLGDEAYGRVVEGMRENSPLKRVSQPCEIAELAWFLAARAPAMTGQVLAIENGLLLNT